MLLVTRRVRVLTRGDGVGVAYLTVRPVDHDLAPTLVADDLLRPSFRVQLRRMVRARSFGTGRLDVPAAVRIRDNVSI